MKIDYKQVIQTLDNINVVDGQGKDYTYGDAIKEALMSQHGEQSGAAKIKKIHMAMMVDSKPEQDLNADEVTMIIDLVERQFAPLIYYRVVELLDPKRLSPK